VSRRVGNRFQERLEKIRSGNVLREGTKKRVQKQMLGEEISLYGPFWVRGGGGHKEMDKFRNLFKKSVFWKSWLKASPLSELGGR